MMRRCGECSLCCRLLPMKQGAYPRERLAEAAGGMIAQGWAKPEDFVHMLQDFDKSAGKPCPHQRHGKGCNIYQRRPFGCRWWNCRWLVGDDTADLRRPDRSRVVIDVLADFVTMENDGIETNVEVVQVWCDPKEPDAWREPSILAYLERRGQDGKAVLVRFDSSRAIVAFPPALCSDGKWHEKEQSTAGRPQHTDDTLFDGLAKCTNVVLKVEA